MRVVGKRVARVDAEPKVRGTQVYPSDRRMDGMLWVAVVRASFPHADILAIDTQEAAAVPGVVKILTALDVPGENAFGIQIQDQPVLCLEKVRYQGDALALVGAETPQAARAAAAQVRVTYGVLDPIVDPEEAMKPGAVRLHPGGNILHEGHFAKGDAAGAFASCAAVIEDVYQVPMMDHACLETEAGLSYLDDSGRLVVESCGQYVFRDQAQIARALGLPLARVRVTAPAVGGAFGGKDEITVQIHLALMTHHTRRPAKLVLTREESIIAHTKRHPARMWYKTGATRDGKLLALEARFVSDTGAYASLGGPVLNLMLEHAAGPYFIPNVKVDGYAVYTNNGFSGAFRGFGCTQACVAIESQLDRLARALAIDPLELRLRNVLGKGDVAALGYELQNELGARATLQAARRGKLYRERARLKRKAARAPKVPAALARTRRFGVGIAAQMQGLGLGVGIPDYAEVELALGPDGRLEVRAGTTELGQGGGTVYAQIAAERLGLPFDRVTVVLGDTARCPDSGTTTASRTTYAVGMAICQAADQLRRELMKRPGGKRKIPAGGLCVRATFQVPVAAVELGDGLPHRLYSSGTHVALVEVNTQTGEIHLRAVEAYLDGGRVVNPNGFEGQSEGGIAQGLGYALFEEVLLRGGVFQTTNFNTYVLPTSLDMPEEIRTLPVPVAEASGPFGAKGISETCTVGVAPAILNALEDAIGVRFTRLPVRPEDVLRALEGQSP